MSFANPTERRRRRLPAVPGAFLPELLARLERELATNALSLWEGFADFCEESVVAVVLEPVAKRIEELKSRAECLDLEPKAETVEEIREGLAQSWRICREAGCLASVLIRGMLRPWREKLPTP